MQPTPPAQDTTDPRPIREAIAEWAAEDWGTAGPAVLTFAAQLADAQTPPFLDLLRALDTAATERAFRQEHTSWAAVVAHLPGLAPTLDLIRAHLQADQPACREPVHGAIDCRLAREAGYGGVARPPSPPAVMRHATPLGNLPRGVVRLVVALPKQSTETERGAPRRARARGVRSTPRTECGSACRSAHHTRCTNARGGAPAGARISIAASRYGTTCNGPCTGPA